MKSLFDYQTRRNILKKELRSLCGGALVCSPTITQLANELRAVETLIAEWGTETVKTYRIM